MLLAIDAGNSNIVFALMKGEEIVLKWRTETHGKITKDTFTTGFEKAGATIGGLKGGVLGSVVPNVNQALEETFKALTGKDLIVVKGDGTDVGITLDVDAPAGIGADRVLNIIAGEHYYGTPLIIMDFGTATTYDVIDKNRAIIGGAIGAGIGISLRALHTETAQLPQIEFGEPPNVIGRNARDAMQSAAFFGAIGTIEGMVARIRAELGEKATTLATGGFSSHFKGKTKAIDHFVPNLTLQGLRLVFERKNP